MALECNTMHENAICSWVERILKDLCSSVFLAKQLDAVASKVTLAVSAS